MIGEQITLRDRYAFHAGIVRRGWSRRHEIALASGGKTVGWEFRWNLKVMREYRERMRRGER